MLYKGAWFDVDAEAIGGSCHFILHFRWVEPKPVGVAHDNVLSDSQCRYQREVLADHADAGLDGVMGRINLHLVPVDQDLTLVGRIQPVEDAHQRCFTGSVFAQQSVNLAGRQLKIDLIVGHYRPKPFGDTSHLNDVHGVLVRGGGEDPPPPANAPFRTMD